MQDKYSATWVGKKNDLGEWVVLSAWMNPPLEGTKDYYKKENYKKHLMKEREYSKNMEKASFWGKLWLTFKKQVGI